LYLAAGFVGWSRIYSDHHYPSDVYAAAALAIAANYFFVDKRQTDAPLLSVWSDGRSLGLALNGHW
jgi:membrane-associated phospholipid phosphatase